MKKRTEKIIKIVIINLIIFNIGLKMSYSEDKIKDSKIENIIKDKKEYNFFDYKVKILKNKDNNLEIEFPLISKQMEEMNTVAKKINNNTLNSILLFPSEGKKTLLKLKENIYIIKDSSGFTIEIQENKKDLIVRNPNFEILTKETFNEYLKAYNIFWSYIFVAREMKENLYQLSEIKINANSLFEMLDNYSVDFDGKYPKNLKELENVAKGENNYWKSIINPFDSNNINAIVDYEIFKNEINKKKYIGYVVYEPIINKMGITKYKIYGVDENGEFLKNRDKKIFILSNN